MGASFNLVGNLLFRYTPKTLPTAAIPSRCSESCSPPLRPFRTQWASQTLCFRFLRQLSTQLFRYNARGVKVKVKTQPSHNKGICARLHFYCCQSFFKVLRKCLGRKVQFYPPLPHSRFQFIIGFDNQLLFRMLFNPLLVLPLTHFYTSYGKACRGIAFQWWCI